MGIETVTVTFETVTPLWTGDGWGENSEIKRSAILGALKFWLEVIYYFDNPNGIGEFDQNKGRFEKEVDRKKLADCIERKLQNGAEINLETKIDCLREQGIPLPAIIFGAPNWKGLVEIERISKDEEWAHPLSFGVLGISKRERRIYPFESEAEWKNFISKINGNNFKQKLERARRNYSFFFLPKAFSGKFTVTFKLPSEIKNNLFVPLLNFMNKYGFWGGRWGIGYGRLLAKVEGVDISQTRINLNWENMGIENIIEVREVESFRNVRHFEILSPLLETNSFFCGRERELKGKIRDIPTRIFVLRSDLKGTFDEVIKGLLYKKVGLRSCLRGEGDSELWKSIRHKLMGERGEGAKIIPFVEREGTTYRGGFLSIAGLLHLDSKFQEVLAERTRNG